MPLPLRAAAFAALIAATAPSGFAAEIDWAMGPSFGGALGHLGILTNGIVVEAIDLTGAAGTTTVVDPGGLNLSFTSVNSPFFNQIFLDPANGIGDAGWATIVRSFEYSTTDVSAATFLGDLTPGQTYQVQFFAGRSHLCCAARTQTFGDGVGNVSAPISHAPLAFQSIVGTFVADGTSQRIVFDDSANAPTLSAYVLLDVTAVPEPGTWALMLAGAGVLLSRRPAPRLQRSL